MMKEIENLQTWLNAEEACRHLGGIRRKTLRNWEKSGLLKACPLGGRVLFLRPGLDEAVANGGADKEARQ